jgi:bifunctional non-homologous end joining protein LigD
MEASVMALDEYRRKRDFTRSPEPSGEDAVVASRRAVPAARYFCVQKHLATQLHYDLRLEHQGVLLSWAVPKGPSLDSSIKRLAMHVEDHPIEYGDFEGVIPDGYGAGVVMLWDHGTWEPESPDIDAALAKGDLKLRLNGYKLKGSWALVRTRGWGGRGSSADDGKSWLLIKHRDEWSGPLDIAEFAPLSVKSELDFPGILEQAAPRVWASNPKGAREQSTVQSLAEIVARVDKYAAERAGRTASAVDSSPESLPPGAGETRAAPRRTRRQLSTSPTADGKHTRRTKPSS